MSTDVSSLLTQGVREVVPVLGRRQLSYAFGEHGCEWQPGSSARALQASFHRVFLAAVELLRSGSLAFHARARGEPGGGCSLQLRVRGHGPLQEGAALERVLSELALTVAAGASPPDTSVPNELDRPRPRFWRARGVCPATQAAVSFSGLDDAGFRLRVSYRLPEAIPGDTPAAPPAAPGPAPSLWLVHADGINAASVAAQAHEHGWAVTLLASLEDAARALRHAGGTAAHPASPSPPRPALVLVFAHDGAPPSALQTLRGLLPAQVRVAYAAEVGSIWWRDEIDGSLPAGCELCCHPLGSADWQRWREALLPGAPPHLPAPFCTPVLVVDDDEVSRLLAEALLEALGCETRVAHDGQQAIHSCCEQPPALVLMDLDMPEVDGFEATRRLRAMQRAGQLPPFRILATSSAPDRSWITDAMRAGTDAFLPKPLRVETLRGELARWCAGKVTGSTAAPPA